MIMHMRRTHLRALVFFLAMQGMAQQQGHDYYLLVGTYTNEQKTNGIHVFSFDSKAGDYTGKFTYTDIRNPSFIAISEDGENVYAVSEAGEGKGVNAFAFDRKSGKLTFLN